MAGVLAQLKVLLGLDASKLQTGLEESRIQAERSGKRIEHSFSGLGKSVEKVLGPLTEKGRLISAGFQGIGDAAGEVTSKLGGMGAGFGLVAGVGVGAVTALGAGLFELAKHATEAGASVFDAAEKTGLSASEISGLAAVAKETNGNFDNLSVSLARMGANLTNAVIDPSTIGARELKQLLGGVQGLNELGLKPMGERIRIVISRAFQMKDVMQRNAILQSLLGRGWQENVDTLKALAENGYAPMIAQAKKLGIYFDDEHARQAKQFEVALKEMEETVTGLGISIGEKLIPMMQAWFVGIQGMLPHLESWGLKIAAIGAAAIGNIPEFIKLWDESKVKLQAADQAQTDYLIHLNSLISGEKSLGNLKLNTLEGGRGGKRARGIKRESDALGVLIEREREELNILAATSFKQDSAQKEYQRTVAEIERAAKKTGDWAEAQQALNLALDIFAKKALTPASIPPPKLQLPGGTPTGMFSGIFNAPTPALTINQAAQMAAATEGTSAKLKILRDESNLTSDSLFQLARVFPGLTEQEIASLPAGAKMIEQLKEFERRGQRAVNTFTSLKEALIEQGKDLRSNMISIIGNTVEQMEAQLAEFAVTGKANFQKLVQSLQINIVHSLIQKGLSSILSGAGLGKRDGSNAASALYVQPVDASGNVLGLFAGHHAAPTGGLEGGPENGKISSLVNSLASHLKSLFGSLASTLSSLFSSLGGGIGSLFSGLGHLFGGFLQGGGDVAPGKFYVVGERHPEFFVPHASGRVVPTLHASASSGTPVIYSPVYNISTPDADSFRKSQAQIVTEGYRHMALIHARNA